MAQSIRRHPVLSFFVLTYAVNIAACAAAVAIHAFAAAPTWPLWLVGISRGQIGAVVIGGSIGGKRELGRLAARLRLWRIGWRWFLAGMIFTLVPLVLSIVNIALGHQPAGLEVGFTLSAAVFAFGYTLVAGPCRRSPAGAASPCRDSRSATAP